MTPPAAHCTGHCCRRFPVSATLEQLREIAADPSRTDADDRRAECAEPKVLRRVLRRQPVPKIAAQ